MTKWILQSSGFNTTNEEKIIRTLNNQGIPFQDVGIIENTNIVSNLESILTDTSEKIIVRSAIKLLKLVNSVSSIEELCPYFSKEQIEKGDAYLKNLRNGYFYNERNFDQSYYSTLGLPVLNNDSEFISVRGNEATAFNIDMFIKPSKDLKAFTSGEIKAGTTILDYIKSNKHQKEYVDEIALVSKVKSIGKEYRCIVVNQEVVTMSQYMFNRSLSVCPINKSEPVFFVANELARLYKPHDVFVMDIAEHNGDFKIVEYNCWNCSGLYACDVEAMVSSVTEFRTNLP